MSQLDILANAASRVGHSENRISNDVPAVNEVAKVMLDHLGSIQARTKMELDILRKTRGQRVVGEVQIPAHLREPGTETDAGVEQRGNILPLARD
jgi:hypothetical protein